MRKYLLVVIIFTIEIISQGQLAILRRKIERQTELEPWVQPTTLHLRVGSEYSRAWQSNMNEEELEPLEVADGRIELAVGAYEAVSILLR